MSEFQDPAERAGTRPLSADQAGDSGSGPARAIERDWAQIIERTAAGDEASLAALYDGTAALVNGLVRRIVRDPHVAEEVTMDVYLQVWRQAARYDRSRGTPVAWLLTLARSRAIDRVRSAGAAQALLADPLTETSIAADDPGPEESAAVSQFRRTVSDAMARLEPEQRRAVELAYFSGMSHSEIAQALGAPLGTIKTRIRLAMMRLRESLTLAGGPWELP